MSLIVGADMNKPMNMRQMQQMQQQISRMIDPRMLQQMGMRRVTGPDICHMNKGSRILLWPGQGDDVMYSILLLQEECKAFRT